MNKPQKTLRTCVFVSLILLALLTPAAFAGIPEPGIVLYGKVRNNTGTLVTSGVLTWTFQAGGDPVSVTAELGMIPGPGGPFSYAVTIPCETAVTGFPVSTGALPLSTSIVSYTISAEVEGTTIAVTDQLDLSDADRGAVIAIMIGDLVLIDTDGDGISDTWEQQIVDVYYDDEIESIEDVHPEDDFDGDGFSNIREFLSDSNALDPEEIPICWADFYGDGDVDGEDLSLFSADYGYTTCPACFSDLDYDGVADAWDVIFFSEDYGRTDCYLY
jgi:hypothetical protein